MPSVHAIVFSSFPDVQFSIISLSFDMLICHATLAFASDPSQPADDGDGGKRGRR
jgi:hypothetical protein